MFRGMIQDDRIWQSYMQWGMMLWHLLTSFFALSLLLKSLFSFLFLYGHYAKCTNQDSNWVYTGTILWHKGWYDTNMIWYVCNVWCRSLMCTSKVAGNTQRLVSISKCRISSSGRPLRFEHWGARGDFASYLPALLRLAKIPQKGE